MDVQKYFERIGLSSEPTPSPEFLAALQLAHVTTVPYENLDIILGEPLDLSADAVYRKVVENHRGGYCFELNALLAALLRELGFSVRDYLGRFLKGESGIPLRRHRIIGVAFDGVECILDVGLGQSGPRIPLVLAEGLVQEQFGESYRFERDAELGWILLQQRGEEWNRLYSFTTEHQYEVDFVEPSFYCERHPDSPFNKKEIVAIKTIDGRKTVDGRTFKVFSGENLLSIEENMSDERLFEVLNTEFGIVI